MKKVSRFLKVLLYLLLIIMVGGYFFISHIAKRAIPDYNKEVFLEGLTDEVSVYRDSFAIPHIYAENEEDLYRTTGYVMAQDRLWQMVLLR
ncbi:MAG: penicillin acylase family protein, partial [Bacteroidota bacterium]|nr:penicillin acylase family protein [Bacteroidota bacterium]